MLHSYKASTEVTLVLSIGPVFDVSSTSSVAALLVMRERAILHSVESDGQPKMTAVVYAPHFELHV